jgi:5-(carboxyamino)imidazole ribonucleotide mutase
MESPIVAIVMGSRSDWATMEASADVLTALEVPFEVKVVSAHRTPALLQQFAVAAEDRGIEVVIAGAGGAAHLPGMIAANTVLPVLGVPVMSKALNGLDSLLSIVQMPAGVPVGTLAIGAPGATNAGVLAAAIVSQGRPELRERLRAWRDARTADVLAHPDPRLPE